MTTTCSTFFHLMIVLTCFQGGYNYLTEKPQNALRSIGQSVTFTCNSSWTVPVRWWFICDTCKGKLGKSDATAILATNPSNNIHVTGQLGAGSPDGYRSTLTINSVTKIHEGIYRCQDGTGSRGFAQLTVTDGSPGVTCMPVSPRDQIVTAGDDIVFTASRPTAIIRYYYVRSGDGNSNRAQLYNGKELNDNAIDERFSVIGVGEEGHADLVLRSVQPGDAGTYIAKDVTEKSVEAAASLVVFDRSPECKQVWDMSNNTVILRCQASYKGELTPRLTFLGEDVTEMCLQKKSSGGTIQCSLSISISNLLSEEETEVPLFEVIFQLTRCGEFVENWVWQHSVSADDIETRATPMRWNKRNGCTIILAVSAVLFILSIVGCTMNYVFYIGDDKIKLAKATFAKPTRYPHQLHDQCLYA